MIQPPSFLNKSSDQFTEQAPRQPSSKRRGYILFGLLSIQISLLFLIFPALIIHFENEWIAHEQGQTYGVDLPGEPDQFFSYIDGLYWSLLTPISLDSTQQGPQTRNGKLLVRISDATKLLTVVTAGMFHYVMLVRKAQRYSGRPEVRHQKPEAEESLEDRLARKQVLIFSKQWLVLRLARLMRHKIDPPAEIKDPSKGNGKIR